jgi:hypothetical protein
MVKNQQEIHSHSKGIEGIGNKQIIDFSFSFICSVEF